MWKEQEGYLLYEPEQDTLVVSEHTEIHNMQKTAGILVGTFLWKKDGIGTVLGEHQGTGGIIRMHRRSEPEKICPGTAFCPGSPAGSQGTGCPKSGKDRNLIQKYIYMDPYTDQIYLIQLPIPEPMQSHIGWEEQTAKLYFKICLGKIPFLDGFCTVDADSAEGKDCGTGEFGEKPSDQSLETEFMVLHTRKRSTTEKDSAI